MSDNHQGTGIGCDIEEVDRFSLDLHNDEKFLKRIFTSHELGYCFSFQHPAPHLAARFCAKEAVVKALCTLGEKPIDYARIEIRNDQSGAPFVKIYPGDSEDADNQYHIMISLSHCKKTAMAMVLITRKLTSSI